MAEVVCVVEGETEAKFAGEVLAPWLGLRGVNLNASRVGKPGHKGGNVYAVAKRDIGNYLKQRTDTFVTCFFDFYGMKNDWPDRESAGVLSHDSKAAKVESAIRADILNGLSDNVVPDRFIPYVQMHEFEALLFSDPSALAKTLRESMSKNDREKHTLKDFDEIRSNFSTPEHINDNPNSAPSKRIIKVWRKYGKRYGKVSDGGVAAARVAIETMRAQCPHFASWLARLEQLGTAD